VTATDHIRNSAWGTRNDVLAVLELPDILTHIGPSNASMALNIHVVTQSHDNGLDLGRKFAGRGENKG